MDSGNVRRRDGGTALLEAEKIITASEILQRLAAAKDREHLIYIWNAFERHHKAEEEVQRMLFNIKQVTNTWGNGRKTQTKKWR